VCVNASFEKTEFERWTRLPNSTGQMSRDFTRKLNHQTTRTTRPVTLCLARKRKKDMPTVKQFAAQNGCNTAALRPLNNQILEILLDRVNTAEETNLVSCADIPLLRVVGNSTIPLLQPAARASLQHAIEHKNREMHLFHAYRTIAHQFVLREWIGRCGIVSARKPGTSDHERGLAIDIDRDEIDVWTNTLKSHGWQDVHSDPGHFHFVGDGVNPNLIAESVRSFQILWNRNNPDDLIDQDGVFGDIQTGPRLLLSPIEGFPIVS